jgi:tetrahydromethanopterin S-methyltransferase subunit B
MTKGVKGCTGRGCTGGNGCGGIGLNWVFCDACNRVELYENCGMDGAFDVEKIKAVQFVCDFCKLNESMNDRVVRLEQRMDEMCDVWERMKQRVDGVKEESVKVVREARESTSARQVEIDKSVTAVQESVKVMEECLSAVNATQVEAAERMNAIGVSVTEVCEKVNELGTKLGEMESSLDEMVAKQGEFGGLQECEDGKELYSTVLSRKQKREIKRDQQVAVQVDGAMRVVAAGAGSVAGASSVAVAGTVAGAGALAGVGTLSGGLVEAPKRPSFAESCARYKEGTVLVVGSSMARGVGQHLKADNLMFDKLDFSGARIEDIKEKVAVLGDRPDSHMVVMVGTNNLQRDGSVLMMKRYGELVEELKRHRYRQVSLVGLLKRGDFSFDSRIMSINCQLKVLCERQGIGFVEVDIDRRRMLGRDGIHLNWRGCEVVARKIFKHSCSHLNLV